MGYRTTSVRQGSAAARPERPIDDAEDLTAEKIRAIAIPTLVIWGKENTLIPAARADHPVRDTEDAKVTIIPDAGHLPHKEQADTVNALITDFMRRK